MKNESRTISACIPYRGNRRLLVYPASVRISDTFWQGFSLNVCVIVPIFIGSDVVFFKYLFCLFLVNFMDLKNVF